MSRTSSSPTDALARATPMSLSSSLDSAPCAASHAAGSIDAMVAFAFSSWRSCALIERSGCLRSAS
ncbi:MAG: hypothetical protein U1F43_19635 [Myxococcota bacterium]